MGAELGVTAEQVMALWKARRHERGPIIATMDQVYAHYENKWSVPLPQLDKNEKPAIANFMALGVDQMARRVASVIPNITSDPTSLSTQAALDRARARVLAAQGWQAMNHMPSKQYWRARFLVGLGESPVRISPVALTSDKRSIPYLHVMNPRHSFPASTIEHDDVEPADCIFESERPIGELQAKYPMEITALKKNSERDKTIMVLEYVDAYETVLVALSNSDGKQNPAFQSIRANGGLDCIQLGPSVQNRMEICPVVFPGRITLGHTQGQFAQTLGIVERMARLDALYDIAVFKGVFPEKYLTAIPNTPGNPKMVQEADARQGITGIVENGQLQVIRPDPGPVAPQRVDQLERSMRLTGVMPAEWGGESGSNIRTARRGEQVLGESTDLVIQEYQTIMARSGEAELRRMVACQLAYFPKPTRYFFLDGDKSDKIDYTPKDIFAESKSFCVEYPMPGMDASSMTVAAGQKIGMGILSKYDAMRMDPSIKDPDETLARIELEGLSNALETALEQGAISGQVPHATLARIAAKLAATRMPLYTAVNQVDDEMKQEQAAQQQQQVAPQMEPNGSANGATPGPEQQPGIGQPVAPPPIAAPPQGSQNLMQMLQSLHAPQGANAFAGASAGGQ